MKPSPLLFQPTSRLTLGGTEDEVIISCQGRGLTTGTLIWLTIWGVWVLGSVAIFLCALAAPLRTEVNTRDYLLVISVLLVLIGVGITFMLQCFQSGWNNTTVSITHEKIAVRYMGKFARRPYSFPLSKIREIGIRYDRLVIMFYFRDYRTVIPGGTKAELEWVEDAILTRMKKGGWKCVSLETF